MPTVLKELPVTGYADALPTNLLTAAELAEKLGDNGVPLGKERLIQLADAYYIPHYRIDGGPPMFAYNVARGWIAKNITVQVFGQDLPVSVNVLSTHSPGNILGQVPQALSLLSQRLIQADVFLLSGIYFLCSEGEVVYVGQSMCLGDRLASHVREGKKIFDHVYILPALTNDLSAMEGAFIRALSPRYNIVSPCEWVSDADTMGKLGFSAPIETRLMVPECNFNATQEVAG